MIKLHDPNNKEMMTINTLDQDGRVLIISGKIFGSMPLTAKLYPEDARAFLKMLNFKMAWFLITLPLRRRVKARVKAN